MPEHRPPPPDNTIHLAMCQQMTRTVLRLAADKIRTWQALSPPPEAWQPGARTSVKALINHRGEETLRLTKTPTGKLSLKWRPDAGDASYRLLHGRWDQDENPEDFLYKVTPNEEPPAPANRLTIRDKDVAQLVRTMVQGLLDEQAILTTLEYHTKDEIVESDPTEMHGYTWFNELVTSLITRTLCRPENLHQALEHQLDLQEDLCHCKIEMAKRRAHCLCFCPQCVQVNSKLIHRYPEHEPGQEPGHAWAEMTDEQHDEYDPFEDQPEILGRACQQEGRNHLAYGQCPPPAPYLHNWHNWHASPEPKPPFDLTTAANDINRATAGTLIDPEVLATVTALTSKQKPGRRPETKSKITPKNYNQALRHLKAYAALVKTAPGLATFHYRYSQHLPQPKRPLIRPGQMVSQLKRATKLRGQPWTILHRLTSPDDGNFAAGFRNPNQAGRICRHLAEANRPHANGRLMATVATTIDWDRLSRSGNPRTKAKHRENFRRMLSAYLGPEPGDRSSAALRHVSDAVHGTSMEEQHWGNASWEQMTQRAHRWHEDHAVRKLRASGKLLNWQAPVAPTEIAGYTLTPLTSSQQVTATAARMRNCLNLYIKSLSRGTKQVFLLEHATEPTAAVMLSKRSGWWRIEEAEGIRRATLSESQWQAAKAGLALYNSSMENPG